MTAQPAYTYAAMVTAVHDGDTITVDIDLGFAVHTRQHVRLLGCNAIELAQPGGAEARDHLASLFGLTETSANNLGHVVLRSVKPDKYGDRYDAAITLTNAGGTDLVTQLIADGWAAAWDGKGPKPVPAWPRIPAASEGTP
jgi:endonuclease YncB( thermonuclease family)